MVCTFYFFKWKCLRNTRYISMQSPISKLLYLISACKKLNLVLRDIALIVFCSCIFTYMLWQHERLGINYKFVRHI